MATIPINQLRALLLEDKVIPVIGAGVSAAVAALPGWKGAIADGFLYAENRNLDKKEILTGRTLLENGQLTKSADILKKLLNAPANPFATWVDQLFGSPNIAEPQLLFHIHELCCPIILTTNYDNLISETILVGRKSVFDWSEYQEALRAIKRSEEFIFHLHGRIHKPETIILSADDYQQLAKQKGYKTVLEQLFMNYHFLFIGCSRDGILDDDFITILNFLNEWFPYNPNQHFILMNERDIEKEEHKILLKDSNIEAINYGKDYAKLSPAIAQINPNRKKLLERINMAVMTYLKIDPDVPRNITEILANSRQYKSMIDRLQHLRSELENKRNDVIEYTELSDQIDALETSILQYKKALLSLIDQLNRTDINTERLTIAHKLFEEGRIEDAIASLKEEELEREAEELKAQKDRLNKEKDELDEKAKHLSNEYLFKAYLVLLNFDDPDRIETAVALVSKSTAITDDPDCLKEAGQFYSRIAKQPQRAISIYLKLLSNPSTNSIERILLNYDLGTIALSIDLAMAKKYLTNFCEEMKLFDVNDPFILSLLGNGLHNLSCIYNDTEEEMEILDEAIAIRRRAAEADPYYLPLLTYSLNKKCGKYIIVDKEILVKLFDESLKAMETFLSQLHEKSAPLFEDQCMAGLIILIMGYKYFDMTEQVQLLQPKIEVLVKQFDNYITSFEEKSNLGVANAYHQYFMVFGPEIDVMSESSQWMMERSIFHYKKSLANNVADDNFYFGLAYALFGRSLYKQVYNEDHFESLTLRKEALSNAQKIKDPDDKANHLLKMLNEINAINCDCENCRKARERSQ